MPKFGRLKPLGLGLFLICSLCLKAFAQAPEKPLPGDSLAQPQSGETITEEKPAKKSQPEKLPAKAQADELYYDREKETLTLIGNVKIEKPPFTIYGDEMTIDLKTNIVHAKKNVKVIKKIEERDKEMVLADEAEINLDTEAGYLVSGKLILATYPAKAEGTIILPIPEGQITITGARIEKINDHQYLFNQGSFTSCQCEQNKKPDLSLQAKEINADTESVAKMRSVYLLIREQRIFYFPYYEAPISNERKTGVLPPEFGYTSRGGYYASVPYFLVMGPSADLTVYPTYIQKRGFLGGAEFRYNLGPISNAVLDGFAIEDRDEGNEWRWSGTYLGESSWESGYLREDVRLISDNEYIRDFQFQNDLASRWQREMESKIIFSQNLPLSNLSAEFKWTDDIAGWELRRIQEYRPDQDSEIIQQVPAVSYQLFNQQIAGPLGFDLRSTMVNYWREEEEMGRAIQAGLTPRLTLTPYLGPGVRSFAFAGYRLEAFSQYYSEADQDAFYLTRPVAGADLSLTLEKIYHQDYTEGNKYRHLLEPGLAVIYQGEADDPDDPFLARLTNDRETGLVGARIVSLLFQKKIGKENPTTRILSEMEINQFYDWVNEEFLDMELKGFVESAKQFGVETDLFYDIEAGKWRRTQAIAWIEDKRMDRFWAGYVYSSQELRSYWYSAQQQDAENWIGGLNLIITKNFGLSYRIDYSVLYEILDSQSLTFNYLAKQNCWAVSAKISQNLNPEHPEEKPDYSGAVYFQILSGTQLQPQPEWTNLSYQKIRERNRD